MHAERRYTGEVRSAEGRRIVGRALTYGEPSATHRERFEPGAFGPLDGDGLTRWLDIQHNPLQVIAHTGPGGGLTLTDGPDGLDIEAAVAPIPAGEVALAGVNTRELAGLSVEFHARQERREGGLRVIERAVLRGVGLVRHPSYEGSRAEVRQGGGALRASIPVGKETGCECCGDGINEVRFGPVNVKASEIMSTAERVFKIAKNALAVAGSYQRPLASLTRKTLAVRAAKTGLAVEIALPDSQVGREIMEAHAAAGVVVRPIVDFDRSTFNDSGGVREYSEAYVRGFIVGATDVRDGWPDPVLDRGERAALELPDPVVISTPATPARRRTWL